MNTALKGIILCTALALSTSCSSNKSRVSLDEPEKLEKTLNTATPDKSEKVGVKDKTVVIQKRIYLEEELSKLQGQIGDLENSIYGRSRKDPGGLWTNLQKCRKRLADPRLGGDGNTEPMEKWERISDKDDDFNYGVDERNNVIAYSEENLETRIINLKKMKRILDEKFETFQDKAELCENKYNTALINHGIKPEDAQAQGEWVDGPQGQRLWKMRRPSTDDPEELMRRKTAREKSGE